MKNMINQNTIRNLTMDLIAIEETEHSCIGLNRALGGQLSHKMLKYKESHHFKKSSPRSSTNLKKVSAQIAQWGTREPFQERKQSRYRTPMIPRDEFNYAIYLGE